ncbi:MAG TPA: DegT/DnrJ/EryC1/StrS family aminotransferase [Solirubrobacteraceae bacterium]|jgi:dTDP-4-amino-4,6-dideoxygalactose transaminase|nr:DegT/DnrJ/EryC1/StrS family aminotransferase [Solirubrobacteraceae bacterium]
MRTEFLVFGSPVIGEEEIAEVVASLRSGWVGTGPKVQRFEGMLAEYVGVAEVRCLSSCTAALILALRVLGVGPGDEVLVPTMTFVASANAVEHVGAKPVLIDAEPGTGLIDLDAAEAAIGPATRAIIPVHLAGRPIDMDRLNALRDEHGVAVIEDAAHAIGAQWRGQRIGSHGNVTAYSFYVTKNLTTVEGGALATEDPAFAARVERLALHGLSLGAWARFSDQGFRHYEVVEPGFKYNMTDLQAALGLHQLPRLDAWIDRRAELWERYDALLRDLPLETPLAPAAGTRHARHLYQVLLDPGAGLTRDELLDALGARNIGTGVHYRGVHLHPYYRDRYHLAPERYPVATSISERTLSLPLSPKVTDSDQDDVVLALRELLAG